MKKTLTKRASSVFIGDTAKISVHMEAKVTSNYQSFGCGAALEATVAISDLRKGYEEAWQVCEQQLGEQVAGSGEALQDLTEIATQAADLD